MRAGVHQQGAGEAGLQPGQLAEQHALHRSALDGVEIRHVARLRAKPAAVGVQQRDRIAHRLGHERRDHGLVPRAVARLRPDGDAAGEIEHGNDVHAQV